MKRLEAVRLARSKGKGLGRAPPGPPVPEPVVSDLKANENAPWS